jgi:hypothetical protein
MFLQTGEHVARKRRILSATARKRRITSVASQTRSHARESDNTPIAVTMRMCCVVSYGGPVARGGTFIPRYCILYLGRYTANIPHPHTYQISRSKTFTVLMRDLS